MSTVLDVADKAFRDYLSPGDETPVVVTFAAAVTADATSWTYSSAMLSPDELDFLAPGTVVEAGDGEQVLLTNVDTDASTLTVSRGYNGTVATAHATGGLIVVAPVFGRRTVIEAVKDEVASLYPSLHSQVSVEVTTDFEYIEVPAEAITPVSLFVAGDTGRLYPALYDFQSNFVPSSTGKAIVLRSGQSDDGRTAYFTYRGRFARPSYDQDELSEYGVERHWERIISTGAALAVTAGRDPSYLTADYVTEALERESNPPDTAGNVRNRLIQLRNLWLDQARSEQVAAEPHPVVQLPVGAW